MKRHKTLMGLSQDHENGLLLALAIKNDKALPYGTDKKAEFVQELWERELKRHLENEENILFPKFKGRDYEIDLLINEIIDEHKMIKGMINKLNDKEKREATLNKLSSFLEEHILKEEKVLFKKLERYFEFELDTMEQIQSAILSSDV